MAPRSFLPTATTTGVWRAWGVSWSAVTTPGVVCLQVHCVIRSSPHSLLTWCASLETIIPKYNMKVRLIVIDLKSFLFKSFIWQWWYNNYYDNNHIINHHNNNHNINNKYIYYSYCQLLQFRLLLYCTACGGWRPAAVAVLQHCTTQSRQTESCKQLKSAVYSLQSIVCPNFFLIFVCEADL